MTTYYVLQAVRIRTVMVPPPWMPRRITETFSPTFCLAVVFPGLRRRPGDHVYGLTTATNATQASGVHYGAIAVPSSTITVPHGGRAIVLSFRTALPESKSLPAGNW